MELSQQLFDSLTAKLQRLVPRKDGEVGIYCCGPTVYDVAHAGHARAALAPDLLVRHLRAQGVKVKYVRNITDVDDKILERAGSTGQAPMDLSSRMAALYQEDMARLGCVSPDVEPKVSEHIPEIISLCEGLIDNGAAYAVTLPDGATDVYFAVREFPAYGKLSKRKIDDLRVGARVEASAHKRDPLDFALWKGVAGEGWGWDSPWGKGRPGWHIECSVMSVLHLGYGFEVHCGGMDLIFPHHENEIAQSEAAHPQDGPFVRIWIHNGFVNVDKEKMAKSLGNFVTMRDVFERYDPEALRYWLLGVHYRGPIGFETDKRDDGRVVFPGIAEAERRIDYLYSTRLRLAQLADQGGEPPPNKGKPPKELAAITKVSTSAIRRLREALDDDLNTPVALAVLADVAKAANELCDLVVKRRKDKRFVAASAALAPDIMKVYGSLTDVLGLLQSEAAVYQARTRAQRLRARGKTEADIEERISRRAQARADKDFATADAVRQELLSLGVELADSPAGTTWRVAVE